MDGDVYFKPHDYILFATVLATSSLIGLYFAMVARRKGTVNDYLMGGNNLGVVPVAFSLTSSVVSPVSMLAMPSENYRFGITLIVIALVIQLVIVFIYFGILPVFCELRLVSIYEYIQIRFDSSSLRKLCSGLYVLTVVTSLSVVVFLPAIALEQGTGFNMQYITYGVAIICTLYTAIGGIKTVVWTDAFQFAVMVITSTSVILLGIVRSGGVKAVLKDARDGGRLDVDFSADPTRSHTFWAIAVGYGFFCIHNMGANQACIQKCFTLPSRKHIKRSLILYGFCLGFLMVTTNCTGLVLYSTYKNCDPFSARKIKYHDQLLPYFVLHVLGDIPGIAGLFIAGIFSASLSTLSAGMNALSCTVYNDFLLAFLPSSTSEASKSLILKLIVVSVGLVVMLLVLVVGKLGTMMAVATGLGGLFGGPIFGVFLLGLFSRRANARAAFCGILGSVAILSWIFIGQQYNKLHGLSESQAKPVSVRGCLYNSTVQEPLVRPDRTPFFLYEISFFYFTLMGSLLTLLIGLPVGFLGTSKDVPEKFLSPLRIWRRTKDYAPVDIGKEQKDEEAFL